MQRSGFFVTLSYLSRDHQLFQLYYTDSFSSSWFLLRPVY